MNRYRPGDKVAVTVLRDGKERTFTVELKNEEGSTEITRSSDGIRGLGATFNTLSEDRKEMGISAV